MARKKGQSDDGGGAPEWMVTFSDCMTLLLTFFVLLLSFSSFDDKKFRRMETAMAEALPSVGIGATRKREAFTPPDLIQYERMPETGSERPTLQKQSDGMLQEHPDFLDFDNQKVFLIPSNRVFLGSGTFVSLRGSRMLSDIASLLREVPNRVVVSEHGPFDDQKSLRVGLRRSWTVSQHLRRRERIDKDRLSISAASTMPEKDIINSMYGRDRAKGGRLLEIVILERSIYD